VKYKIMVLIVILCAAMAIAVPTKAAPFLQTTCDPATVTGATWCINYNFVTGEHTWTAGPSEAEWLTGQGWRARAGTFDEGIKITKTFDAETELLAIESTHTVTASAGCCDNLFPTADGVIVPGCTWVPAPVSYVSGTYRCEDDISATTVSIHMTVDAGYSAPIIITSAKLYGTGTAPDDGGVAEVGPYQPIREADQIEHIEGVHESGLFFTASRISAKVQETDLSKDGFHEVRVYASHSGVIEQVYYANGAFNIRYTENYDDGFDVAIIYGNLAEVFVQPGDTVTAGCVIGLAGPQYSPLDSEGYDSSEVRQIDYAAAEDDLYENWTLYDDPSGTEGCGGNQSTQNCINNDPRLTEPQAFWGSGKLDDYPALTKSVTFDTSAVTLPNGYYLHQEFIVEGTPTALIATVIASVPKHSVGKLRVSFGDAVEIVPLAYDGTVIGSQLVKMTGDLTPSEPTIEPDIYSLEVANVSGSGRDVVINFICLSEADSPAQIPPPPCYFNADGLIHPNDDGDPSNNWELSESPDPEAEIIQIDNLVSKFYALKLPEDAFASYPLVLPAFEDEETEYVLTIRGRQNPPIGLSSSYLGVDISSGSLDDDTELEINGLSVDLGLAPVPEWRFILPEDEPITDGTLTLSGNTMGAFVDEIFITTACLYPANGVWPGYEDADWSWEPIDPSDPFPDNPPGTTPPGIGSFACLAGIPTMPTGIDPSEWLKWLGAFINWIFDCKFLPVFNDAIDRLMSFTTWITMIGKWNSAFAKQSANWTLKLGTYVINTLAGLMLSGLETIWNAFLTLPIIQWLYDNATLGQLMITAFLALAGAYIELLELGTQVLATLLTVIQIMWVSMADAFTSTSQVDVGLPTCSELTIDDLFYSLCAGFDLVNYAASSFASFAGFYAVLAAGAAYYTITKTIEWVGDAFGGGIATE
jgi:hypothetical protein